jgi:hypothetical protein
MTRFNKPIVLALMRTMLPRAPACYFTKEDLDMLEAETGLSRKQIKRWEENFRDHTLLIHRQARLANPEEDDEKVKSITALLNSKCIFNGTLMPKFNCFVANAAIICESPPVCGFENCSGVVFCRATCSNT